MNNKINTFIFDFFGVIGDPILENWFKMNIMNRMNKTDAGQADDSLKKVLRDLDLGILSEDEVNDYLLKYVDVNNTKEKLEKEIDDAFKVNTYLIDLIRELKQKGYKTALLSNCNNSYFLRKVYPSCPELKEIFDEIIISSVVKMVKPDPKIYLHSLEKLNSKPEESLFIDDNKTNVDGAINVGINGYLYTDNASLEEYIKSLGINLNK